MGELPAVKAAVQRRTGGVAQSRGSPAMWHVGEKPAEAVEWRQHACARRVGRRGSCQPADRRQRPAAGQDRQRPYFQWSEEGDELWVDLDAKRKEARGFSVKLKFPIVLRLK